jgi:hypothetical protein
MKISCIPRSQNVSFNIPLKISYDDNILVCLYYGEINKNYMYSSYFPNFYNCSFISPIY